MLTSPATMSMSMTKLWRPVMPKLLEVRASLSFGVFRAGRVYEVDIEDDRIMSLLGVGYLEPTSDLEDDDVQRNRSAGLDVGVADSLLAHRGDDLARSSKVGEVNDGEDQAGSHGDSELGTSARVRGRETSGVEDSDRG